MRGLLAATLLFTGLFASGKYVPGTPGGAWTSKQISVTRDRIHALIDPRNEAKIEMFGNSDAHSSVLGPISENTLLRLAFHDCLRYPDGSGGCDGCLNWKGMGFRFKNFAESVFPEEEQVPRHFYEPQTTSTNNDLSRIVEYLEKIYTTTDWPASAPSLKSSLQSSGHSRADLWAFAGLVALERTIERANWACDYDFNVRQQVTLLEGRDKCDIKLTKPIKFQYGRVDCIPVNSEFPYISDQEESHPSLNDAEQVVNLMKRDFNMTARHFIALSGIHSTASRLQQHTLGTKYVWFSASYLSNMYYKMIANRPTYEADRGGDIAFVDNSENGFTFFPNSFGDSAGNPIASRGWRLSCMDLWNITDKGPCFFRPTGIASAENPALIQGIKSVWQFCANGTDENGDTVVSTSAMCTKWGVTFDKNGIQLGGGGRGVGKSETGWNNQFALAYEIGMYRKFEVSGPGNRPRGCPGIDMASDDLPMELVNKPSLSNQSYVMDCPKTTYAPEGEEMSKIVEEFADDHDVWAENFLDAWQLMQSNGDVELIDAHRTSWLGHYSLKKAGKSVWKNFDKYIEYHAPLVFTSPEADPFICGNWGQPINSCGYHVSEFKQNWRKYQP